MLKKKNSILSGREVSIGERGRERANTIGKLGSCGVRDGVHFCTAVQAQAIARASSIAGLTRQRTIAVDGLRQRITSSNKGIF